MNYWTQLSIEYASQRNYLDDLFKVYPTIPEGIRSLDTVKWNKVENAFNSQNNDELIKSLLALDLFPIKDSYVAYLKRDKSSIERNPQTVNRLCGRIYEMGLDKVFEKASEPKETNRQIGPLFRRWLNSKSLGVDVLPYDKFINTKENCILDGSDYALQRYAIDHLGYEHLKGLDFIGKFNGKTVIGEAKFLTDFGGHQNAQFNDAISTVLSKEIDAVKIAILDGVLYIKGNNKMFKSLETTYKDLNIMSSLVLRDFLYQI
ncbi:hypothetical protein OBK22_11960 [Empedobacter falsenii]|uniref:hypothetical protein n=1 Tax=Empedobacter stercoris TaxID=1628248 RepID=UPI001CE1957D|nr:hypothetical protein [Empedobacter stercoris]MCA4777993.1 restriction endonuclease [Empedobacter stercoris]